jgi:two-component system cell cycle sensor histidine kinase/response regulator CckA
MKKLLIVDNHPVFLKFMTNLIEKRGHQALSAENGLLAIDILKNYVPDMIFVDLIMPYIDGKQLCRVIRSMPRMKDVKIVIVSGVVNSEIVDIKQLGADACIAKGPFNEMAEHVLALINASDIWESEILTKKILGTPSFNLDISKELVSSRSHYINILDNLSEGVLELTCDGRIVYANSAAICLIGIAEEKLLSLSFLDVFNACDQKKIKPYFDQSTCDTEQIIEKGFEVSLNHHDVVIDVLLLKERSKNFVIVLNDITEKKQIEVQLRQAHKMEAIGTLSGGIAHDFNNILMGIQGNVSLMLLGLSDEAPAYKRLKNIEIQVDNGTNLTKRLLSYAKYRKTEMKVTDFNSIIQIQNQIFRQTKKEITISENLEENIWSVEIDRAEMEQVVSNIYMNADQAMNGRGKLFIQTENIVLDRKFLTPYQLNPGRFVKVTITDNGPGVDENIQEKIFDPFFTTKSMGQGTGLGLSSAYGIIKSHNGIIQVDSKKGEGATIIIYLPASDKHIVHQIERSDVISNSSETILLVDDEEMILDIGKEMLERIGHSVLTARSGEDALKVIENAFITDENSVAFESSDAGVKPIKPDLVILDMMMPGMDGGVVFDSIKAIHPELKVLLSSGYSEEGEAASIMARGCDGFIQKPFKLDRLSMKVRQILTSDS